MKKTTVLLTIALLLLLTSCTGNMEENSSDYMEESSSSINSEAKKEISIDKSDTSLDISSAFEDVMSDDVSKDISESEITLNQEEADRIMNEIIEKYNTELLIMDRKLEHDENDIHKVLDYSYEGVDYYFTYYRVTDPRFTTMQHMKDYLSSFLNSEDSSCAFKSYFIDDEPESIWYIEVDGKLYMLAYDDYYCCYNPKGDMDWTIEGSSAKIINNKKIIMNMKMKNPGTYRAGVEYEPMEVIYNGTNWVLNGAYEN